MGLVSIKETPEGSFVPSATGEHREKTAFYELKSGPSPDIGPDGTLTLDFPASRTVKPKCLRHSVSSILL